MGGEIYIYSIFVFILICVLLLIYRGLILLPKNRKAAAAEEESANDKEKEERLFRLYQNIEEMMDNFEAYIEETREQFEAAKADMQQQAAVINDLIKRVEATEANAKAAVAVMHSAERLAEQKKEPQAAAGGVPADEPGRRASRPDAVRELLAKGLTVEQIAQKLELSINEVRLVVYGLMAKNTGHK